MKNIFFDRKILERSNFFNLFFSFHHDRLIVIEENMDYFFLWKNTLSFEWFNLKPSPGDTAKLRGYDELV